MTGSRSVTKPVAVLVSVMMLATTLALGPAAVAGAASAQDTSATPSQTIPDELGRETRLVQTALKCSADGGTFGPLAIPFEVPIDVNSPTSIQKGKTFDVVVSAQAVEVPATFEGLPVTINNFTGLNLRALVSGGFEVVSVTADTNSGFYQPNGLTNPNAPKQFINPNSSQLRFDAPTSEVRLSLPGPYNGNSVIKPPNLRVRVRAVGENGDLITSQLGGTIPQQQTVFPWPSFSFNVTVSASLAGITTITAPAYCAPNFGRFSDIPGNDIKPVPFLSRTVIDDRGPDLDFRTPRDGFVYDVFNPEANPDSKQLIADFACTDPSGVVSCEMTDGDGNTVVPGQRLPDTFNYDGELTLRATDEFGFTSERTIQYSVSSNSVPNVDAGDDIFAGTLKRVELDGNATDVDFGQLISYRWIQVAGPAVELAPTDDPFDTVASFVTPPGPEELIFALRADDGQGYAEDFVSVFVDPNNAPQITNKQFQFLGFCPFGELADDQRCDDTPIPTRTSVTMDATATDIENEAADPPVPLTYTWRQVDENGNDLDPDNEELVTLSSTDSPVVTFDAPQLSRELTLFFEVLVSDGDPRADVVGEVTVRVRRNLEPVFGGEGDEQVIAGVANGNPVRMQALATDPEGRTVTYEWRQVDAEGVDLPEGDPSLVDLTIIDPGAIADFTSLQSPDPYELYFRVVASDGLPLGEAEASIEVQVLGNEPPSFTNLAPPVPGGDTFNEFNVLNRQPVEIDASATDPEARALTYAWRQVDADGNDIDDTNPDWLPIADPTAAVQTFTGPDTSDETTYYFAVVASDGVSNGSVEALVKVTFGPNLPPTLEDGYEQFVSNIETRGEITLDGTATDPEGGTVSYLWSQVDENGDPIADDDPDKVILPDDLTTPTITFDAPDTSLAVVLFLKVTVSDGLTGGSADALFTVSVRGNNVPVITAPASQFGVTGLETTLDGAANDLDITNGDNQSLSWAWVQVTDATGDTVVESDDPTFRALTGADTASPKFTEPISNDEVIRYFRLTVSDGFDPVVLVVTVTLSPNNAPFANAGEDQEVPRGTSVTLNGSGTDPDGHSIGAYEWTQVDASGDPLDPSAPDYVTLSATDEPTTSFTAPNLGTDDVVLYFELIVFDEFGQVSKDPDTVVVTVRNQAPTANAGADQSGRGANTTVTVTGSATDPDVPFAVTYLWEQVDADGNPVTDPETGDLTDTYLEIADPTAASTTFITPQTSSSRTYYLQLTVTDDGGLTATDTVAIQVNPVTLATPNVVPGTSGTVGSYIQLAMPRPGAPGNPSDNFTYDWYQTDSPGSTIACAPTCLGGTAVIHTEGTFGPYTAEPRRPVIEVPGRADRNPANSFFRVRVADTFGGGDLFGAAVTITTTNTDPTVNWSVRGYGSDATARLWTDSTPNNPVWAAGPANSDYDGTIVLDATENPAIEAVTEDLDADTITYTWKQFNNPYSWGRPAGYVNKSAAVTAVTGNFNIPGGNRNCDNINLGGVNNLANGARVLLVGQNDPRQNGVWIVPNRSSSGFFGCRNNGGQWARAGDLNSSSELEYARVAVTGGSQNGRAWVLPLFSSQINVGSTNLNWQREDLAGPAGANEPIFAELANTGRNTQTPQLRSTQSGSGVNTVTNTTGIAYLRTPVNSQFPLELTVTDGLSAPQSFRMVVRTSQTANAAPVATRTSPASQTIRGGVSATLDPVTLGATIDDAQARPASSWPVNGSSANENLGPQSLTYQWLQTDASGNELAADDPDRVVITNPDPTALGQVASATSVDTTFIPPAETKTLYFRVRTTDGIKTSLSDVQTVVVQINRIAPVADAGEAQDDVLADQTVTLDGSGSADEDGTIEGYLWEQVDEIGDPVTSGPTLVTLSDPTAVSPTFTAPSLVDGDADLYFRLTVTDDFGDTGTDTVRIGVLEDGAPTAVASFSPDPVVLGQTATLSGEGSSDPEGQTLSYSWVQEDGSGNALATDDEDYVELTDATSRDATFTVPAREVASTLYFRLTVADGAATPQDDSALVTIAVRANRAPTASASAEPSSAGAGVTVTLSSDGTSDPDEDTVAYLWEQVDESDELVTGGDTLVTLSDATAAAPTFTAPGLTTPSTLRFRLTASDEFGLNDTAFVQVEVAANVAPTVDPSASPNPADPGDTVTLSAGAADPEGVAPLTYAWTQTGAGGDPLGVDDPVVTVSDDTAAEPTFTAPGRLDAYTLYFEVVVTDEFGAETTDTVSVAVNANRAPTVNGSASPNPAPAGATVTLSATGSDPDGDDVTYAWVQVDAAGDPVSGGDLVALTGADTANPTFAAPDLLAATTLYFRVTVADPYGATATTTVEAGITENRPPLISASASPSDPAAGATVTLTGTATDPEGRDMTYQWTQVDGSGDPVVGGVTLSGDTTLSATFEAPGFDVDTDLFFELAVTDDTGVPVTTTVTVNVQANQAPVASISGSAAIAPPGATVTLDGTASSDPEGDGIASYLWSQTSGPEVTIVDPTSAMTSVVTPVTSGGLVILQLVVTDRWGKESSPATLAVALQPNNNPFADAGAPQSDMLPGQTVTLDGSGSMDADGHEISFAWTQLSGPAATLSDNLAEQPTFVPLVGGDYLFELVVLDQFGGISNPAYVLVKVNDNRDPVVDAGDDQLDVVAATVVTLSGTVSDPDVEGGADQTVTSIWTQIAGDPVDLEGDDDLTKTFRVPSTDEDQTLVFQLTADDGIYGGSTSDEVSIFVKANRVPVVDAGEDQDDVVASTVATLEATVTDADIEAGADQTLTYTWTQTAGDPVTLEGDDDLTKTFRVPSTDADQTLTFRLTSGDGTGEGFDEVSVNVLANRVPVVDAGEDQDDVVASTLATLEATVTDADIEAGADQTLTYTWTQTAGDPVTLEGDDSLTATFRVPATDADQTLTFRLTSGDGTGEGFDEVSVNVLANRVPTVDAGEDQSGIVVGTSVTLTGTAADADIDAGADQELVAGWTQLDPLTNQPVDPAVSLIPVPFLSDTVEFEAPSSATAEEYVFAFLAFDGVGGVGGVGEFEDFSLDLVTVSVNANRIPIVDAGEPQAGIAANEEVTLSGSATDPDIDEGSSQEISGYTWTQISGTTVTLTPNVDGTSATFNAPSLAEGEALVFQLAASDGTGEGTATVTISVNANRAPTAEAGENLADIEANDPVTLTGVGTDEDPQNLTYLWTQTGGDPVSDLSPTDQATISFKAPINNEPQELTFELAVSDGTATTTDTVTVGVKANRAPVADAGPTLNEVGSESMVTLDGRGSSDPEGEALTYSWAQTAGTPVTLDGADTPQPTFMAPLTVVGASLAFTLTVTDPLGKTGESTVGVTVVPNRPPVADAGEGQLVPRRRTVTLDGTGSSDPDGQAITYAWVQVTGVGSSTLVAADDPYFASLSDVSAAQPTFLSPAPANDGDEIYFMLVVVDSTGRPSLPSWTTVTLNLNDPPVATAPEPQTGIAHNQTVTLGVIVEDPDGEEVFSYQWVQIDADDNPVTPTPDVRDLAVELSDPTAEAPTFVAPYPEVDTELRFRVVVTDLEGATDDAVVTVEVLANRAPVVTMDADLTGQNPNTTVNLGGSAVDPDGDEITYTWVQIDDDGEEVEPTPEITDTAVELTTTEGTTTSFTTPIVNSTPTLQFRLRATDSEGAFTDGIIKVGLVANRAPTPFFGPEVYITKQSVDAVQASNFSIPTGNRGCSDVTVGGRTFGGTGRVLLVGQNDPRQNGIWDIPSRSGTGFFGFCSNNGGQWRRAGNADSPEDLQLTRVAVTGGSGNGQTWMLPLTASQINGFPNSNLNYGSTSLSFVRLENVGVRQLPIGVAVSGGRSVGSVVTLSYPAVADGTQSDPDGTPSSLFTYRIVRVANADSTTPCADATCGGAGLPTTVTEVPDSDGRQATFTVPGVTSDTPLYFRMLIDDGFGAVFASPTLTVGLQNTAPSINNTTSRDLIRVVAGADVRIDDAGSVLGGLDRTVVGGPGEGPVSPNNVFNDGRPGSSGNFFPQSTYVYGGVRALLDARPLAAAADPDGGATVRFQAGLQPVGTAINLDDGLGVTTRNPNGVCQAGFTLQPTAVENVWAFTPPTGVTENGGYCRIQFQVSDPFASPTTWGVPVGCLSSGLQTLVGLGELLGLIPEGTLPPCTEPNAFLHIGDRNQNEFSRAANVTLNRSADFWLQVFQNVAKPNAQVDEIPGRVFSSSPGQEPVLVTLDGSDTIDADGTDGVRPTQPLLYKWTALDPGTLQELPDDADANQRILDRGAPVTQFALPDGGPEVFRFRLDVYDGNQRDIIDTGRMRVTVRRPTADGTATLPGGEPQGTPAENPYSTAVPNVEVGAVQAGDTVALSSAGSANPDGRTLKYQWRIISGGASAEIQSPRSADATLVVGEPTLEGAAESEPLVVELAVRDGFSSAYKTFTFDNVKTEEPTVYCPDPTSTADYPFTDVGRNTSLGRVLACLVAEGVLSPNSRFNPANTFTRAQMILVLHRLAGLPTGFPRANFSDVPNSGPVRDALNWANFPDENGVRLVSSQSSGRFRPDDAMQRYEFALFLHRYIGTPAPADPGPPVNIIDLPASRLGSNALVYFAQKGVFPNSVRIDPEGRTRRDFMADVVWKFGQIVDPPLWEIDPDVWEPRAEVSNVGSGDGEAVTVSCPSPATLGAYPFGDVPADAAYRTATACLVENGVLKPNPSFNPDGTFTRAQMLLVLHRLAGRPGGLPAAPFDDVSGSGEVREALNWGFAEGLVNAQANRRFRPNDPMQRVELALFLWRSVGRPAVAPDGPPVAIVDVPSSGEYRDAVTYLAQRGVVEPTGFFNPSGVTQRSFMAETVFRFGQIRNPALWQADPGVWQPRS